MNSIQLREKRAALVNDLNTIVDIAQTEGRSMNAEENQKFDNIETDVRGIKSEIERIERAEELKREFALLTWKLTKAKGKDPGPKPE